MARQAMGEKRTRRLARRAGIPGLQRVLVRGGSHTGLFRTEADEHGYVLTVPPYTFQWAEPGDDPHWSSCPGHGNYNGWMDKRDPVVVSE
jgi:hypothetical protein